ncbi:MAG: hypothetical protein LBT53_01865 [Puniceicoccales bacterium]|nr:hypothetical protein [Puniceicoccales bacterium]
MFAPAGMAIFELTGNANASVANGTTNASGARRRGHVLFHCSPTFSAFTRHHALRLV